MTHWSTVSCQRFQSLPLDLADLACSLILPWALRQSACSTSYRHCSSWFILVQWQAWHCHPWISMITHACPLGVLNSCLKVCCSPKKFQDLIKQNESSWTHRGFNGVYGKSMEICQDMPRCALAAHSFHRQVPQQLETSLARHNSPYTVKAGKHHWMVSMVMGYPFIAGWFHGKPIDKMDDD